MTDVCLILEGTYPYTRGGVSACVYNLIANLPQVNFSIVHLTATGDTPREIQYPLPSNIKEFKEFYLFDIDFATEPVFDRTDKEDWNKIIHFHNYLKKRDFKNFEEVYRTFFHPQTRKINVSGIFKSRRAWEVVKYLYLNSSLKTSFSDFFWNWRFIHYPLFKILSYKPPEARIYHTMCTGYAGALCAVARIQTGKPAILTEHGIYTSERELELSQAEWIAKTPGEETFRAQRTLGFFKQWWTGVFYMMGRMTYEYADQITTLFEGNRLKQIELGADPLKTMIIPNGVDLEKLKNLKDGFPPQEKSHALRVAFVGRVVPIKDVKTFLRAISVVVQKFANIEVFILGPTEEDPAYYQECLTLSQLLGLESTVQFKGHVPVEEYYPMIDVVVLTSHSEGQPLVILEANAAGVPVVATDVGACRELLYGRTDEDRDLGQSGIITSPSSAKETAEAIMKILGDEELKLKMGHIGQERISRFYQEKDIFRQYQMLYQRYF